MINRRSFIQATAAVPAVAMLSSELTLQPTYSKNSLESLIDELGFLSSHSETIELSYPLGPGKLELDSARPMAYAPLLLAGGQLVECDHVLRTYDTRDGVIINELTGPVTAINTLLQVSRDLTRKNRPKVRYVRLAPTVEGALPKVDIPHALLTEVGFMSSDPRQSSVLLTSACLMGIRK